MEFWDCGYEAATRYEGRDIPAYAIYLRWVDETWSRAQRLAFFDGILAVFDLWSADDSLSYL